MELIEITATKAVKVEGIIANGVKMVNLRQMYKKKTDKEWQHGRSGISIELDSIKSIRKAMIAVSQEDEEEFVVL